LLFWKFIPKTDPAQGDPCRIVGYYGEQAEIESAGEPRGIIDRPGRDGHAGLARTIHDPAADE